ncbi:hypothetical protein B7486_77630, partial [cyanobacterium TDX16]
MVEGPAADEITTRYGRFDPARYAQNLTVSPDMETDAHLARSLYRQATGTEVDGVLVVDPFGLAALLALTGPVDVEGIDAPVTAASAPRLLLHDQYLDPGADRSERKDRLEDVADATFTALTERDLPGPTEVGQALATVVEERRLLFFPFLAAEDAVFTDLGTTGRFAPDPAGDHLS